MEALQIRFKFYIERSKIEKKKEEIKSRINQNLNSNINVQSQNQTTKLQMKSDNRQLQVAESVAHEIYYFLKDIRGPVFTVLIKNIFLQSYEYLFEFLRFFLEKAQHFSSPLISFDLTNKLVGI